MIRSFHNLEVCARSKELYKKVANITKAYPREGKYLADQTCRSANSIHANIAEGSDRSEAEFKQYLTRSLGSNNETISHVEDAFAVGYIEKSVYEDTVGGYTILGKQLYRLKEKWVNFSKV